MNSIKELSIKELEKIFKEYPLYSQDSNDDKEVIIEFYIPNQNIYWFMTEGSIENDDFIMFGYCRITDGEFGYVSFNEMINISYAIAFKNH